MENKRPIKVPDYHHIKKQLAALTEEQKRSIYERWGVDGVRLYVLMEEYGLTEFSIYTLIRTVKFNDGMPYWEKDKVKAWVSHPSYRTAQEQRAKQAELEKDTQEGA